MNIVSKQIDIMPSAFGLLAQMTEDMEYCLLGDFAKSTTGQYSYFAVEPSRVLGFNATDDGCPFSRLKDAIEEYILDDDASMPVPFCGGWIGYFSYELGGYAEKLPSSVRSDIPLDLMRLGFYDTIIAWDHIKGVGFIIALDYDKALKPSDIRLQEMYSLYQKACSLEVSNSISSDRAIDIDRILKGFNYNIQSVEYHDKVDRAIEYIKAGDIFEVNISQRFDCAFDASANDLYIHLLELNPAEYAALIKTRDNAIVSASPELFLQLRGRSIITRPIKGTIARGQDKASNNINRKRLLNSIKDTSELNMIIDLERNDLGRICEYGSVEVVQERDIQEHPTVFHAQATIGGRLGSDIDISDIMRATFPGGSITGAPKIRAMEIIDELEPTARSVYTGSIGWIGINGDMELNIAIRTILLTSGKAYLQAGGAVVADSTPGGEYDETIVKASSLLRAIAALSK